MSAHHFTTLCVFHCFQLKIHCCIFKAVCAPDARTAINKKKMGTPALITPMLVSVFLVNVSATTSLLLQSLELLCFHINTQRDSGYRNDGALSCNFEVL